MPPSLTLSGLPQGWLERVQDKTFLTYLGVSVAALLLDVSVYAGAIAFFVDRTSAAALGYSVGMILHYVLSRYVVFASKTQGKAAALEAITFVLSGLAGLILTSAMVYLSTHFLHLGAAPAKMIAVAVSFISVYAMRRLFVFAERRHN
ncbi:MAG: hypothetical protein RL186_1447 [Pseudomonadota bacterium]|jgi:putative flippase GtrA